MNSVNLSAVVLQRLAGADLGFSRGMGGGFQKKTFENFVDLLIFRAHSNH